MVVSLSDLATQLSVTPERLIAMFEDAGLPDKNADDTVTPDEKRSLMQHMLKGRLYGTRRNTVQSLQTHGKTGNKREIVVEIKGGLRTVAPPVVPVPPPPVVVEPEPAPVEESPKTSLAEPETEVEPVAATPDKVAQEEVASVEVEAAAPAAESTAMGADETEAANVEPAVPPTTEAEVESKPEKPVTKAVVEKENKAAPKKTKTKHRSRDVSRTQVPAAPGKAIDAGKDSRTRPARSKTKQKTTRAAESKRKKLHVAPGRYKQTSRSRDRARFEQIDNRMKQHGFKQPLNPIVYEVEVSELNQISDLAQAMSLKATVLIGKLLDMGQMARINDSIDKDTAFILVEELGHQPKEVEVQTIETTLKNPEIDNREQLPRPPVVAVMGHVDHGKTTLLDQIRSTKVAQGEKGGITQHIGAYIVQTSRGKITFFDTPGHEAFAAMRVRGAQATDIVVLVVAADDGVKPQTIEAINHAHNAQVPLIVAINKIDKIKSNPDRVQRELTNYDVMTELMGGETLAVNVSALKGTGIDDLLEAIELQAELLDLEAPVVGPASGVVIEARVDRGRGPVATALVQKGTLHKGDYIVAGVQKGRVRALTNDLGKRVNSATPSTPIEIEGLSDVPEVGDDFLNVPNEKSARELVDFLRNKERDDRIKRMGGGIVFGTGGPKNVNVLIKADVQGSAEALSSALKGLSNDEVAVKVIHEMVGGISQSDVNLAITAEAIIFAFNVRADATARKLIDENNIHVVYSNVIYDAIDTMKEVVSGMIEPKIVEEGIALVEVREVFKISRVGTIAGCYVQEGTVRSNAGVRVLRNEIVIHDGVLDSLRRFKNDVSEVRSGMECGIGISNYYDLQISDVLEIYQEVEVS